MRVALGDPNAHAVGAAHGAFAPAGARRPAAGLASHDTPGHAGWLTVAELELSVLARQCLSRRIPDARALADQVGAWQDARNRAGVRIDWCSEAADARREMPRVYPRQTPAAVR